MMSVASSTTPGNRAELVVNAFDADGGDGGAFDRAQQDAAQRVADGGAETALKRLGGEHAIPLGERLGIGDQPLGFLESFEHRSLLVPLLRVQFDDQLLVELDLDEFLALRVAEDPRLQALAIHLEPVGDGQCAVASRAARIAEFSCSSRALRPRRSGLTMKEGMSTFLPFTGMWPWRTNLARHGAAGAEADR